MLLLKNAKLVNEGQTLERDVLIEDEIIAKIDTNISHDTAKVIDLKGNYLNTRGY